MIELTMEQVRSMFDRSVFERGMEYFNEGKIHHVRHTLENGRPKMECRIQGDGFYQVTLVQQESGRLQCCRPRLSISAESPWGRRSG